MDIDAAALEMFIAALSRICDTSTVKYDSACYDQPLTGSPFYLNSIDLLYLLLLLEEASGKTLDRTAIYRGEFSTPRRIVRLLCSAVS